MESLTIKNLDELKDLKDSKNLTDLNTKQEKAEILDYLGRLTTGVRYGRNQYSRRFLCSRDR